MAVLLATALIDTQPPGPAPLTLPAVATTRLVASLKEAGTHTNHLWRDVPPMPGGLVNAYIEIPLGERNKLEFDMRRNALGLDRVIPASIGGYPVNYGFVPQTISYDGDPFDVLVLGPARRAGEVVRGRIVGLMQMEDEKGLDSKVVVSPVSIDGTSTHALTTTDQTRIAAYFNKYKADDGDPATWAKVPGWGTAQDGLSYVQATHAFFMQCRERAGRECALPRP